MKSQPPRKPAERKCKQCGNLYQFESFSNRRWNDKDRVCCNCKPFAGRSRMAKKVSEKVRAETRETCKAWPLDGKVDKPETFFVFCNARKNSSVFKDECGGCKIKALPGNVGIL